MVKAELYYNPYIIETKVKFNGNNPRINSLIEKYEDKRLQDWLDEIPMLFREELNGYDFDLEFIGTDLEFEEIKTVFEKIDTQDESVNIVHAETLMDRNSKISQLKDFFEWLSTARSDYFDYNDFCSSNEEYLTDTYPFMVINGTENDISEINTDNLSIEYLDDFCRLKNANLNYNPILICVDKDYTNIIHNAIDMININNTVTDKQVFFLIREKELTDKIKRFIEDLGVSNPNLVYSSGDKTIVDYIDAYPLCQHIYELLGVLKANSDNIAQAIKQERDKIEESHKEEFSKLEILELSLERVDKALDYTQEYLAYISKSDLEKYKTEITDKIEKWKDRSVVILGDDVAEKEADNLIAKMHKWNERFVKSIKEYLAGLTKKTRADLSNAYVETELESGYIRNDDADFDSIEDISSSIDSLKGAFLSCRVEKWVEEKHFRFMGKAEVEKVLKGEYDVSQWREIMFYEMDEILNKEIDCLYDIAAAYCSSIKNHYLEVLNNSKLKFIHEREQILNQLSDDVREVEKEKIWAEELAERIETMERT